jgi:hypothetical protein
MDYGTDVLKRISLLAALAQAGSLFQVGQVLTASALVNANFVLFNNMNTANPIWLLSARVMTTAAMEVDLYRMDADPALTAGNAGQNQSIGNRNSQATFEAQAVASPAAGPQFGAVEGSASNQVEMISAGGIYIPRNKGIMISSALVAGNVALTMLWAEIDADFWNWLADREE